MYLIDEVLVTSAEDLEGYSQVEAHQKGQR